MNLQNWMKSIPQVLKPRQLRHQVLSHDKVRQQSPQQARWLRPRMLQKRSPLSLNPRRGIHELCTLEHLLPPPPNDVEPMIATDLPLAPLTTHILLYRFMQRQPASRCRQIDSWTPLIHCLELLTSQSKQSTKVSVKMQYHPHHLTMGYRLMTRRSMTNLELGHK